MSEYSFTVTDLSQFNSTSFQNLPKNHKWRRKSFSGISYTW